MRRIIGSLFLAGLLVVIILIINGVSNIAQQQTVASEQELSKAKPLYTKDGRIFETHLPVVVIDAGGRNIEKEKYTWAEISIINPSNSEGEAEYTADFTADAVIKYRGSSSYSTFDKKQYRIEFRQGYGKERNKNYSVMGMSPASDWVLNAPFLDRSLIRNRLAFNVAKELFSWSPDTRYCEVFLDGEYQGLYLMIEPVTNEEERLGLNDFGLASGQTAYVLKRDRDDTEENVLQTYGTRNGITSYQFSISFPTPSRLTKKQYQWIERDISKIEEVLYSDLFDHPDLGYSSYIDVASFVDYYIINEFTLITDAGYLSTYVYKDINGKLKTTVWDFNNSFDNYPWDIKSNEMLHIAQNNWYKRLFQDRKFTDAVVVRYRELRQGVLSEENLLGEVDKNVSYLGKAIDRNFEIWGYTFHEHLLSNDEQGNNRDPHSYEEAVEQLKKCIIERGIFLDENIEDLYDFAIN